ncbi:MAG: SDR family NAD(P)-dependent oxidoreductase [Bacteroidaceae bacterium]|nr:SDR family NAD(P)-dependent oxidoreductase [Bacteroidaceae bacterium]
MNILIIGATSGIGYRLWQHYSSQENKVAVMGRRKDVLDAMAQAVPSHTVGVQCDIADVESFNAGFNQIVEHFKALDLVVVCAGIGDLNPDLDVNTELAVIKTNVDGWTNCVDAAYHHFATQKHGHLVTITSVGGLQPTPIAPSYSASKAFQINYTKSLQKKAKGSRIVVTEIRPGLVDTRMAKGDGLFWVMPLDKVTKSIIKAIETKRSQAIITGRWRIINFLLKHFC